MRLFPIMLALAGCAAPARSVDNTATPPVAADPHGSRDALVHATIARVAANDLEGLIELGTARPAYDRVLACSGDRPPDERDALVEHLTPSLRSARGLSFELVGVEASTEDAPSTFAVGEVYQGTCTTKAPITWSSWLARLRVGKPGGAARAAKAWVNVLDIGGRWYLAALTLQLE